MVRQDDVEIIREALSGGMGATSTTGSSTRTQKLRSGLNTPLWTRAASRIEAARACGSGELRDRNFELHEVSADDVRDVGGKVLVLGSVRFRGRASGTELQFPFGWVCEMRDGALLRMLFYSSQAEALETVGLRE